MNKKIKNNIEYSKLNGLKIKYETVSRQVISAFNAINDLEIHIDRLCKIPKKDKLYEISLKIHYFAKKQVENLEFVGIAGQINNMGIDFINLINSSKIILDGVDITASCKKMTVELIRKIIWEFEVIKEIPMSNLITSSFILNTLNSELQLKENISLKNIEEKHPAVFMNCKEIKQLEEYLHRICQLYQEACLQIENYSLKSENYCSGFQQMLKNLLFNIRSIENCSELLPTQLFDVQESLNKVSSSKKEDKEIGSYIETIKNYTNKYTSEKLNQNIKNIQNSALKSIEKLKVNSKYVENFLLNELKIKFPKIINEILNYADLENKKLTSCEQQVLSYLKYEIEEFLKILEIIKRCKTYKKDSNSIEIRNEIIETEKYFNSKPKLGSLQNYQEINTGQILENFRSYAGENELLFLTLLNKFTKILKVFLAKEANYISEINQICLRYLNLYHSRTHWRKAENFSAKIGSVTAAIGTIGCFASFAVTSIHPVVGWSIFSICSLAFIFNLINAINKM